jgi:hypothetical protein
MEELLEKIRNNNDPSITHLVITQLSTFYIKVRTSDFVFRTTDETAVMEALKTNKTIIHLTIHDKFCVISTLRLLLQVLKINRKITHLRLNQNVMDFESIKKLTCVLRTNKTLVNVNLGMICPESTILVPEILKFNRTITKLSFTTNNVYISAAKAFIESIKNNGIITNLNINTGTFNFVVSIRSFLQRNLAMHMRARQCIIELLCIKKYRQRECLYINQIDRNVILMIAKEVWKSRGDFDYWEEEKTNKRLKV